MVDAFGVFDGDVGQQLGKRLQQLDEGQVVLAAQGLGLVARQHAENGAEVVLEKNAPCLKTGSKASGNKECKNNNIYRNYKNT